MNSSKPYSLKELQSAGDGFPDRGLLCPNCNTLVPQFAELSEVAKENLLELIQKNEHMLAMAELQLLTSCPERWAKIWVLHSGIPGKPRDRFAGLPCPHCGQPLYSAKSRQCPHCFASWH
jgi:hypothetical protein